MLQADQLKGLVLAVMWAAISLAVSWPLVPQELPIPSWFIPKLKDRKMNLHHTRFVAKDFYVLQEAKLRGWGRGGGYKSDPHKTLHFRATFGG